MYKNLKLTFPALAILIAGCGSPQTDTTTPGTDTDEQSVESETPGADTATGDQLEWVTLESGLKYADITIGDGEEVRDGHRAEMHYTGWLYDETQPEAKGTQFDSSRDGDQTLAFTVGRPGIIDGWNVGVPGMKVGGRRMLIIPSDLGYGDAGRGPIPGGATMMFDVEVVSVQ